MDRFGDAVRSVERALDIIEALSREEEMGITELSRELALNKATIYRLITTLRLHGYVEQGKEDKYKLTFKIFELGNRVVNRLGIRKIAYPFLKELAAITKETVNLAALEANCVCYIDRIESREPLRLGLDIGSRFPAHCSALGRVLLAYLSVAKMDSYLLKADREGQMRQYTSDTLTDLEMIKKELCIVREQGYAIESDQYLAGIRCIAAPLFDHDGKVVAAMSVAGPTVRVTDEFAGKIIPLLKKAANTISGQLGYNF